MSNGRLERETIEFAKTEYKLKSLPEIELFGEQGIVDIVTRPQG